MSQAILICPKCGDERRRVPGKKRYYCLRCTKARKNPAMVRAQNIVKLAIRRGTIVRQPCEVCGKEEEVHGHHADYEKPREVKWLCREHHIGEHRRMREEAGIRIGRVASLKCEKCGGARERAYGRWFCRACHRKRAKARYRRGEKYRSRHVEPGIKWKKGLSSYVPIKYPGEVKRCVLATVEG